MKLSPTYLIASYLVLIVAGSWYFGNYSGREYSPIDSYNHFRNCIQKAEKGMKEKDKEAYDNLAGLSNQNKGI